MNETELIGNEIGYLKPVRVSLRKQIAEGIAFALVITAVVAILIALA